MSPSRRKFIKKISANIISAPLITSAFKSNLFKATESPLKVHVFSKHLQFLSIKKAAEVAAEIGFAGLDLTVRPKGHVLPQDAPKELPKAIKEIQSAGSHCTLITTAISDSADTIDVELIKTAARVGVQYYRSNWFSFKKDATLEDSLNYYKEIIKELSELNARHKIVGCYQNHSGTKIGASFWEVKSILAAANPKFFGAQYDIRHAVAEGGQSWPNGVKLLQDQIKTIVLKDFKWGKVDGKWKIINVPIGEGMVDFISYFKLLKDLELHPPVSLHLEYPLGGAEKGRNKINIDQKEVYRAMINDHITIQKLWKAA